MNTIRYCFFAVVFLVSTSSEALGVAWHETTRRVATSSSAGGVAVAEYSFRNASDKPVRVSAVKPGCDCVTARADKAMYAPGEPGVIRAEYALGGKKGRQETTILVTTDDAPNHAAVLTLIVTLPEPIRIEPRTLYWRVDESPNEKQFDIVLDGAAKVRLTDVHIANESFTGRLSPRTEPNRFQLTVVPTNTGKLAQATIRLNAIVDGRPEVVVLQAAVK